MKSDIVKVSGRNQYSDSNLAALPKVDLNMVDNTHEVLLPDANTKIYAVEVKLTDGTYKRITEIDFADKVSSISSFNTTKGIPSRYDVIGSYLYLDAAPDSTKVTVTAGLRIWTSPELDIFTVADTTQEPGFEESYHRILSLGASYDYLAVNGPEERASQVLAEYQALRIELKKFYADRNSDRHTGIRPAHRTQDSE